MKYPTLKAVLFVMLGAVSAPMSAKMKMQLLDKVKNDISETTNLSYGDIELVCFGDYSQSTSMKEINRRGHQTFYGYFIFTRSELHVLAYKLSPHGGLQKWAEQVAKYPISSIREVATAKSLQGLVIGAVKRDRVIITIQDPLSGEMFLEMYPGVAYRRSEIDNGDIVVNDFLALQDNKTPPKTVPARMLGLVEEIRASYSSMPQSESKQIAVPKAATADTTARLRELEKLKADGLITKEEFDQKRAEILKQL